MSGYITHIYNKIFTPDSYDLIHFENKDKINKYAIDYSKQTQKQDVNYKTVNNSYTTQLVSFRKSSYTEPNNFLKTDLINFNNNKKDDTSQRF